VTACAPARAATGTRKPERQPKFEQNIEETNQFVKKTSFLKLLNKYKYNSSKERGPGSCWIIAILRNQL